MCGYLDETVGLSEDGEVTNEDVTAGGCPEADKDDLLKYYKDFLMNGCLSRFSEYMNLDLGGRPIDNRPLYDLPSLSYDGRGENDHSKEETDDYYFCKYGIAYAFEYAMLYDIMLRIHNTGQFGVYSFGCGGYIDAWSLLYARANLQEQGGCQDLNLYYQGIDIVRWPIAVFGELIDRQWPASDPDELNNIRSLKDFNILYGDTERRLSKFTFRKPRWDGIENFMSEDGNDSGKLYHNVLMFPKLLNVLPSAALNSFIKKLEGAVGKQLRERRDYYICVSHSPTHLEEGLAAVESIVQVFRDKEFACEDNLQVMLGGEQYNNICRDYKIEEGHEQPSEYKYYTVNGRLNEIDTDLNFECNEVGDYLLKLSQEGGVRYKCQQMVNVNINFQIIKLTKR